MKKWIIGIVLVLAVAGCEANLPVDMRQAIDKRVFELTVDIAEAEEPCKTYLQQDLEMFQDIQRAVQP
jgi:hypothetical protein